MPDETRKVPVGADPVRRHRRPEERHAEGVTWAVAGNVLHAFGQHDVGLAEMRGAALRGVQVVQRGIDGPAGALEPALAGQGVVPGRVAAVGRRRTGVEQFRQAQCQLLHAGAADLIAGRLAGLALQREAVDQFPIARRASRIDQLVHLEVHRQAALLQNRHSAIQDDAAVGGPGPSRRQSTQHRAAVLRRGALAIEVDGVQGFGGEALTQDLALGRRQRVGRALLQRHGRRGGRRCERRFVRRRIQ